MRSFWKFYYPVLWITVFVIFLGKAYNKTKSFNYFHTMANSPSLTDYINKLIEEKGFPEGIEADVMEEIRTDLFERVQNTVNLTMIKNLPPEKLEEANNLIDTADDTVVQEFFAQHIPNLDQVLAGALLTFRDTYLGASVSA